MIETNPGSQDQEVAVAIVEDDHDHALITSYYLRKHAKVSSVNHFDLAPKALEFLKHCEKTQDLPDVILVDINLPVMDGFEFIRQAKACPRLNPVRFVVLSSSTAEKDRLTAYSLGVGYLTKPLLGKGVREMMRHIEAPRQSAANPRKH